MAQFTQESFRYDLVWGQEGRLYAEPVQVYVRDEALEQHKIACRFQWVTDDMDRPEVSHLRAHWKDGSIQTIAQGATYSPDGLSSSVLRDRPPGVSRPSGGGKSSQERF